MAYLTDSVAIDLMLAGAVFLYFLYSYLSSFYEYWNKRGVPCIKPAIPLGNVMQQLITRKSPADVYQEMYTQFDGKQFGGFFQLVMPTLMVRDPVLVEKILIKDFDHFYDRTAALDNVNEPLQGNLFNLTGEKWRNLRYKLTPTFTSGKLKGMFEQICNCGEGLLNEIEKSSVAGEAVEAKDLLYFYTMDVIASCAFGLQFKHGSAESKTFMAMVNKIFQVGKLRGILMAIQTFYPRFAKLLHLGGFNKEVNEYFLNLSKTTVQYREQKNVKRNDFLQLMITLKQKELSGKMINTTDDVNEEDAVINQLEFATKNEKSLPGNNQITDECIAAQSFVFLLAGSEGISNIIRFILFELSTNPHVQKRLQEEVDTMIAKHGHLNFQALKEMTYLDQVVQEGLRKYPAIFLNRICTIPYRIPDSDLILEKGTLILVPVHAIHNDPQNYPSPEVFNPDRFLENNYRPSGTYLPFGNGPRVCIAMRFAILEVKVGLARIMSKYYAHLSSKTQVPLKFGPSPFALTPIGGVWITFEKRSKV